MRYLTMHFILACLVGIVGLNTQFQGTVAISCMHMKCFCPTQLQTRQVQDQALAVKKHHKWSSSYHSYLLSEAIVLRLNNMFCLASDMNHKLGVDFST